MRRRWEIGPGSGSRRLCVGFDAGGRTTVAFRQSYRSDTYRDEVAKILEVGLEDGSWKILSERVE